MKKNDRKTENVVFLEVLQNLETCICRDMGMCIILGTFLGLLPDFWVPFWAIPG